jgi:hypothetical protein
VKNHKLCSSGRQRGERWQICKQVTAMNLRRLGSGNLYRGAKAFNPTLLPRPNECFEPSHGVGGVDIERVEVEAGTPFDARQTRWQRHRVVDVAREDRRSDGSEGGLDALCSVVVTVPIGEEAKSRRCTDFEQRQWLRQPREDRQENGASGRFVRLRRSRQHDRSDAIALTVDHLMHVYGVTGSPPDHPKRS